MFLTSLPYKREAPLAMLVRYYSPATLEDKSVRLFISVKFDTKLTCTGLGPWCETPCHERISPNIQEANASGKLRNGTRRNARGDRGSADDQSFPVRQIRDTYFRSFIKASNINLHLSTRFSLLNHSCDVCTTTSSSRSRHSCQQATLALCCYYHHMGPSGSGRASEILV